MLVCLVGILSVRPASNKSIATSTFVFESFGLCVASAFCSCVVRGRDGSGGRIALVAVVWRFAIDLRIARASCVGSSTQSHNILHAWRLLACYVITHFGAKNSQVPLSPLSLYFITVHSVKRLLLHTRIAQRNTDAYCARVSYRTLVVSDIVSLYVPID